MARKYSERIVSMDDAAREELDTRIREHYEKKGWQATLAKFKPSPIQLRAILAGKDPMKAKAKVGKKKTKVAKKATKGTKKKAKTKVKADGGAKKKAPKKAPKKSTKKNGVTKKVNAKGDLIIEGQISAKDFVSMLLTHNEKMMKIAMSA